MNERGIYQFEGVPAGMQEINYVIDIKSSESEEKVRWLIATVEKCCPAFNTLTNPPPLVRKIVLNGQTLEPGKEAAPLEIPKPKT